MISRTAEQVFIPLTVGGGVRDEDGVNALLRAGADKVSLNSAAVRDPALSLGAPTGSARSAWSWRSTRADSGDSWEVVIDAGRTATGRDAVEWAVEATDVRGAGEVLRDVHGPRRDRRGVRPGPAPAITSAVNVPVVASGGAGDLDHFSEALDEGGADAVLAASRLHYGQLTIRQIKEHLATRRLPVRLLMDGRRPRRRGVRRPGSDPGGRAGRRRTGTC